MELHRLITVHAYSWPPLSFLRQKEVFISQEEDKKLAEMVRTLSRGELEDLPEERKIPSYAIYLSTLANLSSLAFYQLVALFILGVANLLGLLNSSFPIFMCAFLFALIGAIVRGILWKA